MNVFLSIIILYYKAEIVLECLVKSFAHLFIKYGFIAKNSVDIPVNTHL